MKYLINNENVNKTEFYDELGECNWDDCNQNSDEFYEWVDETYLASQVLEMNEEELYNDYINLMYENHVHDLEMGKIIYFKDKEFKLEK